MKQLSKDQFYAFVMTKDIILDVQSENKVCLYKNRYGGKILGKSVESDDFVSAALGEDNTYFICEPQNAATR